MPLLREGDDKEPIWALSHWKLEGGVDWYWYIIHVPCSSCGYSFTVQYPPDSAFGVVWCLECFARDRARNEAVPGIAIPLINVGDEWPTQPWQETSDPVLFFRMRERGLRELLGDGGLVD
jgi:hypothetical protein